WSCRDSLALTAGGGALSSGTAEVVPSLDGEVDCKGSGRGSQGASRGLYRLAPARPPRKGLNPERDALKTGGLGWYLFRRGAPPTRRPPHVLADAGEPVGTARPTPRRPVPALAARRAGAGRALPGTVSRAVRRHRGAGRAHPVRAVAPPRGRRATHPRRV